MRPETVLHAPGFTLLASSKPKVDPCIEFTYLNRSTQSTPFGSSLLYTKQLKASLNSGPQGPCAIPPKQGQSQLISPVSSLNAPCPCASSSSSSGLAVSAGCDPEAGVPTALELLGAASDVDGGFKVAAEAAKERSGDDDGEGASRGAGAPARSARLSFLADARVSSMSALAWLSSRL